MPIVLGLDLGTTTITALALNTETGEVAERYTVPNRGKAKPDRRRRDQGFSEWVCSLIDPDACRCLQHLTNELKDIGQDIVGLTLTGQQHGVVLVYPPSSTLGPLINWQDQRGEMVFSRGKTFTARAQELIGEDAYRHTGCRLATGYMGVTLFWLKRKGTDLKKLQACFLTDLIASRFTGQPPVTDATMAASSGLFDVAAGCWAHDLIRKLSLPRTLFNEVYPAGTLVGGLRKDVAFHTGLKPGLPIYLGLGDNQASFLGSVASPEDSVLVNVGTGGQVSAYLPEFLYDPALETRPFPGGYLLVCAGLTGGRVYAVLKNFFSQVGRDLFQNTGDDSIYETMNRLAATVPPGCDGLRCEPHFSGTRQQPELRGSWSGVSATNWTPAHITRSLLEGMARSFKEGLDRMNPHLPGRRRHLIAAGNGMRENPLLRQLVGEAFGLPVKVPRHREEAAYGAALTAAVGAGIFPDFRAAAKLIRYEEG